MCRLCCPGHGQTAVRPGRTVRREVPRSWRAARSTMLRADAPHGTEGDRSACCSFRWMHLICPPGTTDALQTSRTRPVRISSKNECRRGAGRPESAPKLEKTSGNIAHNGASDRCDLATWRNLKATANPPLCPVGNQDQLADRCD